MTAGTAACIADLFTFPLDTTKVRLQVVGEGGLGAGPGRGVAGTMLHITRTEGLSALYSGIVPGLQRQMAFSAIRIGAYERVKEIYLAGNLISTIPANFSSPSLSILTASESCLERAVLVNLMGRRWNSGCPSPPWRAPVKE